METNEMNKNKREKRTYFFFKGKNGISTVHFCQSHHRMEKKDSEKQTFLNNLLHFIFKLITNAILHKNNIKN